MRARVLVTLAVIALVGAGCAGSALKNRKDAAWSKVPQSLPDTGGVSPIGPPLDLFTREVGHRPPSAHDGNPGGYGHPLRGLAFVAYPLGMALDYAVVRPFYLLGGLAPEWFGLAADDAQRYQQHLPELTVPRDSPRRFLD